MGDSYEKLEEDILYRGNKIILQCDCNGKIKIKNLCDTDSESICKLGCVIARLNNIQMSKKQRNRCIESIRSIGYIADLDGDLAVKKAKGLQQNIEQSLLLKKRLEYVFSTVILFLILIVVFLFVVV